MAVLKAGRDLHAPKVKRRPAEGMDCRADDQTLFSKFTGLVVLFGGNKLTSPSYRSQLRSSPRRG